MALDKGDNAVVKLFAEIKGLLCAKLDHCIVTLSKATILMPLNTQHCTVCGYLLLQAHSITVSVSDQLCTKQG